jgi:hypothetical protein
MRRTIGGISILLKQLGVGDLLPHAYGGGNRRPGALKLKLTSGTYDLCLYFVR